MKRVRVYNMWRTGMNITTYSPYMIDKNMSKVVEETLGMMTGLLLLAPSWSLAAMFPVGNMSLNTWEPLDRTSEFRR